MHRILTLVLLVLCTVSLSAVVAGGGSQPIPNPNDPASNSGTPAWIADPTGGGKQKAAVASWVAHTPKDDQKKARAEAAATLIEKFKLATTVKIKEMNMWVDPAGKTFVLLVAR